MLHLFGEQMCEQQGEAGGRGRHCTVGIAFARSGIEQEVGDLDNKVLAGKKETSNQQCCQNKLTAPLQKGHRFEAGPIYEGTGTTVRNSLDGTHPYPGALFDAFPDILCSFLNIGPAQLQVPVLRGDGGAGWVIPNLPALPLPSRSHWGSHGARLRQPDHHA